MAAKVLNRRHIQYGELHAAAAHPRREEAEQRRKRQQQDPMRVEEMRLLHPLGIEIRSEDQRVRAEQCGVEEELDEELVGRFRHDPADPWAEVVHFADAAIHFAAMVRAVRFPVEASGAERWSAVVAADEDVFAPEVFGAGVPVFVRLGWWYVVRKGLCA